MFYETSFFKQLKNVVASFYIVTYPFSFYNLSSKLVTVRVRKLLHFKLKLLHNDFILHIALLVVTFLVKVTFCAINFVSSHPHPPPPRPPLPADYNDQSNIVFLCLLQVWAKRRTFHVTNQTQRLELSCLEQFDVWLS